MLSELLENETIDDDVEIFITREEFEERLNEKKYNETTNETVKETIEKAIDECLKITNKKPKDINGILFVGGTTKIPFIEQIVKNYLNKARVLENH